MYHEDTVVYILVPNKGLNLSGETIEFPSSIFKVISFDEFKVGINSAISMNTLITKRR